MKIDKIECPECKHIWVPRKEIEIRSCPKCQKKFVLKGD